MPNPTRLVPAVVIFLIASSALCASENLVRNGGFEAATDGRPDHWSVYMAGEWVGYGRKASVAPEDIVAISTDGRTGEQTLIIDDVEVTQVDPARDMTRAIFPIEARMFLLSEQMLAVVDGTSAGEFFKSETPISREVQVPAETVAKLLQALSE